MRDVRNVAGFENQFDAQVAALSTDCAASLFFFITALETEDPETSGQGSDVCGWIDGRFEVFSARIPGCGSHRLAVSIHRKAKEICYVHALVGGARKACQPAYHAAAEQLKLTGKLWEPI